MSVSAYRILFISLVFIFRLPINSNDLALKFGNYFFDSYNYFDAITEYKRYIFFNSDNKSANISYAYSKIGLAYREQMKWNKSIDAYEKSIQFAKDIDIRDLRRIDLAIVYISKRDYDMGTFILLKVELFNKNPKLRGKAAFFRAISSIYAHKWNEAEDAFQKYYINYPELYDTELSKQIFKTLSSYKSMHYKSPRLAKTLSTFIPGSGQIYCGDWINGLNALIINSAFGYLFFRDIFNGKYVDAVLNYFFIFERFYSGNRTNAEKAAKDYNSRLDLDLTMDIMNLISANSKMFYFDNIENHDN